MRIANRVKMGGHDIPTETVRRRFHRGLENFRRHYQRLADSWHLLDNSGIPPILIAKEEAGLRIVLDPARFAGILKEDTHA